VITKRNILILKKINFLDYIITRKVSQFVHPNGYYILKFPKGWRIKKIDSSEHLFTELSTNHGIIINAYSIIEKSLEDILKPHRTKCLESKFKPHKDKFQGLDLISWVYNFEKYKTTILDVSFCIKNDISDEEIRLEVEKERLIFKTLELRE